MIQDRTIPTMAHWSGSYRLYGLSTGATFSDLEEP